MTTTVKYLCIILLLLATPLHAGEICKPKTLAPAPDSSGVWCPFDKVSKSEAIRILRCWHIQRPDAYLAFQSWPPRCGSVDLRDVDLRDLDLVYAPLSNVDLSGADLAGANLSGARLIGTNLSSVNLTGANLSNADLEGASLTNATLTGANLQGARMHIARLEGAILEDADLAGADLTGAGLKNAILIGANLTGNDLSGANLNGANLKNARLSGARLSSSHLENANLVNTDLRAADLTYSYLQGASLIDTNLTGATLYGANLSGANFAGANLTRVNLSGSDLKGATSISTKLSGIDLSKADLAGHDLSGYDLNAVNLSGANLTKVNLRGSDLSEANLNGTDLSKSNLEGTNLSGAQLSNALVLGAKYEPAPGQEPAVDAMSEAQGIATLKYKHPRALFNLRNVFKGSGYREQEREVTFALKHGEIRNQDGELESLGDHLQYLAFETTTEWGLRPQRALGILAAGIPLFAVPYLFAVWKLKWPRFLRKREQKRDGLWRVWPEHRMRGDLGGEVPELLTASGLNAIGWALYFSLLSAFHIGWRDLNVGTWLSRLHYREYTLQATGWVRTVSGIQSLFSVYLLAIWVLTYFGRPFE